MGASKWVHMTFVVAGLLLWFVVRNAVIWVWGYFGTPNEVYALIGSAVTAGVIAVLMWRKESLFTKVSEITNELSKVTWPTGKETRAATIVVIITTIISSMLLGVFDLIWSWATGVIYG